MVIDAHDSADLACYALGTLDLGDRQEVAEHLAACASCRAELAELTELTGLLDAFGAADFSLPDGDGPSDLVLRRTMRDIRAQRGVPARRRWIVATGAAAALVAVAFGGGVLFARVEQPPRALDAPATAVTPVPTGVRTASATDSTTGARLVVSTTPAAGWVRVSASVSGVPAGQRCRLVVVSADGRREPAGSWLVSPAGEQEGVGLMGAALVDPAQVRAIVVENFDGLEFVTARM